MKPRARLTSALAGVALLAVACAKNAPLDTLKPKGPIAHQIYGLWNIVFILAVVVFILVEGVVIVIAFRFRRRKGDDTPPLQTHGHTPIELTWTIVPALLLIALAIPTVVTIFALAREPKGAVKIE